jgi:uracil-DNA glycosylase
MPEFGREELRRLTVGLKEFVNLQQRLGLQLVEGVYPMQGSEPVPLVGADAGAAVVPEPPIAISLEEIREEMGDCRRCKLWQSRTRLVFGVGDPKARLMFIGEAPGAEEDQQGEPFVGESGNLLNNLFHKLELSRQEVYITNVVKSRPPNNRTPIAEEIVACRPFLLKQIQAIRPQIIVTLGAVATNALLDSKVALHRFRGNWQKWQGMAVMPTFHPAYLLRNPRAKFATWDDMQKVMAVYRGKESDKSE